LTTRPPDIHVYILAWSSYFLLFSSSSRRAEKHNRCSEAVPFSFYISQLGLFLGALLFTLIFMHMTVQILYAHHTVRTHERNTVMNHAFTRKTPYVLRSTIKTTVLSVSAKIQFHAVVVVRYIEYYSTTSEYSTSRRPHTLTQATVTVCLC
jgi:hypothetical protein